MITPNRLEFFQPETGQPGFHYRIGAGDSPVYFGSNPISSPIFPGDEPIYLLQGSPASIPTGVDNGTAVSTIPAATTSGQLTAPAPAASISSTATSTAATAATALNSGLAWLQNFFYPNGTPNWIAIATVVVVLWLFTKKR